MGAGHPDCALECERLGVIADVFDKNYYLGWGWPSVIISFNMFEKFEGDDLLDWFESKHNLYIKPTAKINQIILKSPNKQAVIEGNLGYATSRGVCEPGALDLQLQNTLSRTSVNFCSPADHKELCKKYDYVVVATNNENAARDLGVCEDFGIINKLIYPYIGT